VIIIPRRKNEAVVIGEDIVVTVIEIRGDKVRLGIEYPIAGSVHRSEVYAAIHQMEKEPKSRS
jgi:carbon storage regulator